MKGRLALAVVLAALSSSALAGADTDKKTCLAAVDEGQKLRDEGKLTEAREKFLLCASKGCASAIVKQCDEWVAEVERDRPSVLFRARDANGRELIDVRVLVDGTKVADSIQGQPLPLEPGEHAIRFELADGTFADERVIIRLGEKSRMIELMFTPKTPSIAPSPAAARPRPAADDKLRIPLLGWVGGGVFVAGAATTVLFAVMANSAESDLRATCAPRCAADDRDAIQTKLVVANIGAGVGLAGLALAVVTTVLANRHPEKAEARSAGRLVAMPGGIGGTF